MKRKQIAGGLILVVIGILFLLNTFNVIDISNYWSVIVFGGLTFFFFIGGSFFLTILFGILLIQSVLSTILFIDISIWQYAFPVIIIAFGCYLIFKPKRNKYEKQYYQYQQSTGAHQGTGWQNGGGWQNADFAQGYNFQSQQVEVSDEMNNVAFKCNFGSLDISFMQNKRTSGTVKLSVKASFSSVNIFVPQGWNVVYAYNNESFSETNYAQDTFNPDMPTIEISQKVSFSEVKIING